MKFVRRVHLYAGLAVVPFVILYGVTAFLFNHPEVWSTREARQLQPSELIALGRLPLDPAGALVQQIICELSNPEWQVDAATAPAIKGRTLLTATVDSTRLSFVGDDPNGGARIFARPKQQRQATNSLLGPGDTKLAVGRDVMLSTQTAASALVAAYGESVNWRVRSAPRLEFGMVRAGSEAYRATYHLRDGSLEISPTAEPMMARTARSFLLRLHTAHGYPSGYGIEFWWALIVDIMAFAMVAWALTGVLMWWQMKNLRRMGSVALALCVVVTTVLVAGQWQRLG